MWPNDEAFVPTNVLLHNLIAEHPDDWGAGSSYGKALTPQRLGRMLVASFGIHSARHDPLPRGYVRAAFERPWAVMRIHTPATADSARTAESAEVQPQLEGWS